MYHQYFISRLHKNATISDEAVGCEKHPCPSGTGLSPLMREMKMNDYHEQLPCSLENQHYCTKVLQLHWVSNQAPGQPCQGLLGGHVRGSRVTTSWAPGQLCQGLLDDRAGSSWAAMSGPPGRPCQVLLESNLRKVILGSHLSPTKVPNKPQVQGGVPGKHMRKQNWCESLSPAEKAINSHVHDLQLEGRLIFL